MVRRLLPLLACLPLLLSACNGLISETPVFTEVDTADLRPRDGVWLGDDPDCRFDSNISQSKWPRFALWVVAHASEGVLKVRDGKDEDEGGQLRFVIAKGQPPVIQTEWHDEAKEDGKTFYVFVGLEPGPIQADGTFIAATIWPVACGIKYPDSSEIKPYRGITPECRPSSRDAVRSAALASRADGEVTRWRWLRPEAR